MVGSAVRKNERRINYINELEKLNFIKISRDFKTIIFANKNEIFLLEIKKGFSIKREIALIYNETIRYVRHDNENHRAFYVICCKHYSRYMRVLHTHRRNFEIKIECNTEPGMFNILDFNVRAIIDTD